MVPRPRITFESPPIFPAFPAWARSATATARPEDHEDKEFLAGAALAALHPLARLEHPLGSLWRQRQALNCVAAVVRHQGRSEDQTELRDAIYLTRAGDDPGPAGRILHSWRQLADGRAGQPDAWWTTVASLCEMSRPDAVDEIVQAARDLARGSSAPLPAIAEFVTASLRRLPTNTLLPLWLADAALARRLGWSTPVPLLAGHLPHIALRHALQTSGDRAFISACCGAYASAAEAAADLYVDLARRATRLLAIAPKLRSRDADDAVLLLLSEDAQAADGGKIASARSSRRLFERLVLLGGARELTGRSTFRLYGL